MIQTMIKEQAGFSSHIDPFNFPKISIRLSMMKMLEIQVVYAQGKKHERA